MNLTKRIAMAALAGAVTLTGIAATPAAARTEVRIEYRDRDYRDYRDYRYDRRDERRWRNHDRRWDRGYSYRDNRRQCWTEWRYDYRRDTRYKVRYCR